MSGRQSAVEIEAGATGGHNSHCHIAPPAPAVSLRIWGPGAHFHFVSVFRRLAGGVLAAALGVPCYWSVRLAWADWLDRQGLPETVRRASALAPEDARLRARLSDWSGAVARNPYDSASWIRLGLEAEAGGDQVSAERYLLRAAQADHLFAPRWTLANYYFRRESWEPFWQWARAAAAISPEPPVALYRICWEANPDLGLIFDRVVSGQRRLLEGFLYWMAPRAGLDGLRAVTGRAVDLAGPEQSDALVVCSNRILALGAPMDALPLWNRMIDRRLLPFQRLEPGAGVSLTNGDFRLPLNGETFNWASSPIGRWGGGGIRFEFDGNQPERCDLLAQNVPVAGGRRYRLRCRYQASGIARGAGPVWMAGDLATSEPLAADSTETSLEFAVGPVSRVLRLLLVYQRVPGTTRIIGVLKLESVRLELLGQ